MRRSLSRRLLSIFTALALAMSALVAVGSPAANAAPGTIGVDWQSQTAPAGYWYAVTYGQGKCDTVNPTVVGPCFVAVTGSGTKRVMTSPDGITWTERTTPTPHETWKSVTYGNGLFVAVGYNPGPGGGVMTSSDGVTWVKRTPAANNQWMSVVHGEGKCDTSDPTAVGPCFVAVAASGTNRVMTSPDGITWASPVSGATGPAADWTSVTFGNGLFVALAKTGSDRFMTSSDGQTWVSQTVAESATRYAVTYGQGKCDTANPTVVGPCFVAVAGTSSTSSTLITSPDGMTWTSHNPPGAGPWPWNAVTYGNGLFVAVAQYANGRVATSPDGVTWTVQTAMPAELWNAVTYGNGKFVAVAWTTGTQSVMVSPPIPPGPLSFSSGAFGSTVVGTPAALTVTVTNPASVSAIPSAITVAGSDVSVTGGTCAVSTPIAKSNGTCTVDLEWTPSAAGSLAGASLTIAYPWGTNASDELTLTGTTTATPEPGPMTFSSGAFGSVAVSATATLTVTVTNDGTAAATLGQPSVAGTDITVTGGTCISGTVVAVGATCTVELEWTPAAAGVLTSASLTVPYAGGANPSDALVLTGTAGSSPSPAADSADDRPRPVLVTITLVPGAATACAGGHVRTGYVGEWLSLPENDDCLTSPRGSRQLLGWSTSAAFPLAIAQRQATFGWGTYIIDDDSDQPVVVYIPVGWKALLTGSNTLYPIWSA